jgi:hypothetical protein
MTLCLDPNSPQNQALHLGLQVCLKTPKLHGFKEAYNKTVLVLQGLDLIVLTVLGLTVLTVLVCLGLEQEEFKILVLGTASLQEAIFILILLQGGDRPLLVLEIHSPAYLPDMSRLDPQRLETHNHIFLPDTSQLDPQTGDETTEKHTGFLNLFLRHNEDMLKN